jgi:hypothetical protein
MRQVENPDRGFTCSLLQSGRVNANHGEWILRAIEELRRETGAERVGAWLEEPSSTSFRGEVWEERIASPVLEWTRVTTDVPLQWNTLEAGLAYEARVGEALNGAIVGPQLELRRVLWTPVMVRRKLRGLIMAGTTDRKRELSSEGSERVAEALGLLLELDEERRLAAARKADLDFWLRVKRLLSEQQSTTMILGQLVESCTRGESTGGVGAVFALIGEWKPEAANAEDSEPAQENHILIRAQSGDSAWTYAVERGPLDSLWRQAIGTGRAVCDDAAALPLAKQISKFVALPIEQRSELAGVLLAGLPKQKASLETLDRLRWRCTLATEIFEQERRIRSNGELFKTTEVVQTVI